MFNMRNALMAGVPLLVVNGQQDSRFLIHNPVLGAPNTQLAETATKYSYEVRSVDEIAVALQRCYLQSRLQPTGPVFLSIPMNFMLDRTSHTTFKRTQIVENAVPRSIADVVRVLAGAPRKKLVIVADYAVGAAHAVDALSRIASALDADIYAAPFHVQGAVDPLHPNFRGQLPPTTREINRILSDYHTLFLVGEKIDTFTYDGGSALPAELQVVQLTPGDQPARIRLSMRSRGGSAKSRRPLEAIAAALGEGGGGATDVERGALVAALEAKYPAFGERPSDALILGILRCLDLETHIVTEGSSEDAIVQDMATRLGFRNVYFSPRGGGLGWAMPLGVGIGLGDREARRVLRRRRREPLLHPRDLDRGQIPHPRGICLLREQRVSPAQRPLVPRDGLNHREHALRGHGLHRPERRCARDGGESGRTHRENRDA